MKRYFLSLAMLVAFAFAANAADWSIKQGPMMTKWSEHIDPANVLPEYPRPQMERDSWLNLNGVWDLRKGVKGEDYSSSFTYDKKILVPYPIESAISGVMEKADNMCYWYKRTFTVPASMKGKNILLNFGAVDWETRVFVNGQLVGSHTGGYDPFSFDITSALKGSGEQEIAVYIFDNTGGEGQPTGKQSKNPSICWYTAVSGIWQTVWLEPVESTYITNFAQEPNLDRKMLSLQLEANNTDGVTAAVKVMDREGNVVAENANFALNTTVRLTFNGEVHPWSPEDPYLYDVEYTLTKGGKVVDKVKSYCGMRKIEVKVVGEYPRIFLNNKQIFQMGPLDQGWWPDGLYTQPSDEALIFDIKGMKDLGMNMIRKHIKTECARWYYYCDRMGMLVWQDLPSGNIIKGGEDFAKATFEKESLDIIKTLKNFPSIIHWTVFNEGWGQFDTERMTTLVDSRVNQLTPARYGKTTLIACASGWTDAEVGNIIDSHSYPEPSCPMNPRRAAVNGEYGGITLHVPGHIWPGGDFQYTVVESSEDFTNYYNKLADQLKDLYCQGLNAAVYTQLSDVEIEKNGFYTYDRRVLKPADPYTRLKSKVLECLDLPNSKTMMKTILSTSYQHPFKWRYKTTNDVPRHWYEKKFDDRSWGQGEGMFANNVDSKWNNYIHTKWTTSQIYMRRWFYLGDISEENMKKLRFLCFHDDDIKIYINGVLALTKGAHTSTYVPFDISKEALAVLKPNSWNLIAIEGKQGGGGQVMDVGIVAFTDEDFDYTESFEEYTPTDFERYPQPVAVTAPVFQRVASPVPAERSFTGKGGVAAGQFFHTSDRSNVAWGDYDNDGLLELTYSGINEHNGRNFSALYKFKDGAFTHLNGPFDVCYHACPVWLDYNNDGELDLFVPGLKKRPHTQVEDMVAFLYKNCGKDENGVPTFEEVNMAQNMGIRPIYNDADGGRSRHWVSVGDYNNDGYTDIIVTGREDYVAPTDTGNMLLHKDHRVVYLYKNLQGKGFELQEKPIDGVKQFPDMARGSVNFVDFDNDGLLDIVASGYRMNEGQMFVYFNNGDGTFSESEQVFFGSYDGATIPADFNGDGYIDLLVSGFSSNKGNGNAKSVFIYENNGNRTFSMHDDAFCGFEGVDGSTPSVADVNHDGRPDLFLGGHGTEHEITTWMYLNKGDFNFEQYGPYYNDPFGKKFAFDRISHGNTHLIDYDNDGYVDAWSMGWAQSSVCSNGCSAMLYKNVSANAGIEKNEAPSVPTGIQSLYDKQSGKVMLSWNASTDDVTPSAALVYNVYVKKVGADAVVMTVPANVATGFLRVGEYSGAVSGHKYSVSVPFEDADYEWGVQAIDGSKLASKFAVSTFNPAKSSGVSKKKADQVKIHAENKVIYYSVPEGASVCVYDVYGKQYRSVKAQAATGEIKGLSEGVYLVAVSSAAGKVAKKVRL